jgi:hypothetical protein
LRDGEREADWAGRGGQAVEEGRDDDFKKTMGDYGRYTGKVYMTDDGIHGTEILSMGLQKLYEDPAGFAAKDPEFFNFVLGVVQRIKQGEARDCVGESLGFVACRGIWTCRERRLL